MPTLRKCLLAIAFLGLAMGMTAYLITRWPDGFRWFSIYAILAVTIYETGRCLCRICIQDDGFVCDRDYFEFEEFETSRADDQFE